MAKHISIFAGFNYEKTVQYKKIISKQYFSDADVVNGFRCFNENKIGWESLGSCRVRS